MIPLFLLIISVNKAYSDDKIYLDLINLKFTNKVGYKSYETSSQLLIKTNLENEIKNWIKNNVSLKGKSGDLTVQILDESIIDSFVKNNA